jgi:hypothetical protein
LNTALCNELPDDPRKFLLEHIRKLQSNSDYKSIFGESDLHGLFTLYDTTGRGVITPAQFQAAMADIGAAGYAKDIKENIKEDHFVRLALEALDKRLAEIRGQ